ncbi:hypothetical protein JD844_005129 [Phrynosoma platyrhinos]|uniref:Threonylcarbamoyl-AMP synthase n=1 Tax=Phrynosoma platyrhinos TaxID=52577 RepID=A0ABQ7TMZ2_PHRPL|nr:hypothetical protein JD844_005129 [Phrynosoma platyrhinos]
MLSRAMAMATVKLSSSFSTEVSFRVAPLGECRAPSAERRAPPPPPPAPSSRPPLLPSFPPSGAASSAPSRAVDVAASALRSGGLVALPTETVYGVACLAQDSRALRRLYRLKGRDPRKPLALCLPDLALLPRYCKASGVPQALLQDLLPGPVTVVLERSEALNKDLNPFTPLVGIRIPSHWFPRELARACAAPLALTSANVSNKGSTLAVTEFEELWPHLALVVDGGPVGDIHSPECRLGSTVIDLSVPGRFRVIRPGWMAPEGPALPPDIRSALQKAFRTIWDQHHEAWKRTLTACGPLLGSLGNLAQQMLALRKVALDRSPLRDFPDLPERLTDRHRAAAEAVLARLRQEKLLELQKVRDAVGVHVAEVSLLCDKRQDDLGLEGSFQRSSLCPSLADMMEWLLDIEGFYHRTYLEAKLLLLQIRYENLAEMQALPKAWEQVMQHSLQSTVEDALLKVSFFLEEAT